MINDTNPRYAWKIFLFPLGILFLLHFAKDITQDVLGISTFLDKLGDLKEDASHLPDWLLWIYHWGWVNATLAQPLIAFFVFQTWRKDKFNKYDLYIVSLVGFFLIMFLWAYFLSL